MRLVIDGSRAIVEAPIPPTLLTIATKFEGRKKWLKNGGFSFEPTHHNMNLFHEKFPDAEVDDKRDSAIRWEAVIQGGVSAAAGPVVAYKSKTTPYGDFQVRATRSALDSILNTGYYCYALFMEQGTGKSKVTCDIAGELWCRGMITGMIVMAFNGVHHQWVDEAVPDHLGEVVPRRAWAYRKKKMPEWLMKNDKLAIFTINFESVATKEGRKTIDAFITMHGGKVLAVVDEGQRIKNPEAKSTIEICEIGAYCKYRMDLTGTPIAKDLTDVWSQFNYLDPRILGYKYKSVFRARYCRMHPNFKGVVVGSKNEREMYDKISPYVFRVTKDEELDLPPKVYDKVYFDLHPDQRKVYDRMKEKFLVELDSGQISSAGSAAVAVMRLHQITCGYLALDKDDPDDAIEFMELPNPRLETFLRVRKSRLGKAVTWCRFNKDIRNIIAKINSAVDYYGATDKEDRMVAKRRFSDPEDHGVTDFVSNPAAGGTGVDGLQRTGRTAIYYSNSYNSIHRWQSEDRTHRIGMGGTCTYIDIVARRTVDVSILTNLRKKKSLSDLMLDDIRNAIVGEQDEAE